MVTVTTAKVSEVQTVYLSTSYTGTPVLEVQQVVCDASGGSFQLVFGGYTTAAIPYNADKTAIKNALQQIQIITLVTVDFVTAAHPQACINQKLPSGGGGFKVTFNTVQNKAGNLPRMTALMNNLLGLRYIVITTPTPGQAPIGGTYRLSFLGAVTADINPTDINSLITALNNLDTIPSGLVTVLRDTTVIGSPSYMYRVTFSSTIYGNVEALQVVQSNNLLTGTNIGATVFKGGMETVAQNGGFSISVQGNAVTGTFILDYRGYQTIAIDVDASDTQMQTRLQALPNIGSVNVARTGPSAQGEYVWTVTFMSMPGSFPDGTGAFILLVSPPSANILTLLGTSSLVSVTQTTQASASLTGTFTLTMTTSASVTEVTGSIAGDASAAALAFSLNQLLTVGSVSVSRTTRANGYTWLVTFDGCKVVNGTDVCSDGPVFAKLIPIADAALTASTVMSTAVVVPGVGSSSTCGTTNDQKCVVYVTDMLSTAPLSLLLTSLTTGSPYYVRVAAHTTLGYGSKALTLPGSQIPSFRPPGAPPAVRLTSSTSTTITVEWAFPRYNGGAIVMGFELYIDDWAGGDPRLVFDGTDQPNVLTKTVDTTNGIQPGKSYRFIVRAINYCVAGTSNKNVACLGTFSEPSVFAARGPRVPLPPTIPYRSSSSLIGATSSSGQITIRWHAPIDNGGSPITGYSISMAAPGAPYVSTAFTLLTTATCAALATSDSKLALCTANFGLILEATFSTLKIGSVYRFYVVAQNARGNSAASPVLSVVAGKPAGMDSTGILTYSLVSPTLTAIDSTAVTLAWPMPASTSTGGTPLTGYQVYMFAGVGLNTLSTPIQVYKEVQLITSSVTVGTVSIGGSFSISFNNSMTVDIPYNAASTDVAIALEDLPGVGVVTVTKTAGTLGGNKWSVTFESLAGNLPLMVANAGRLTPLSSVAAVAMTVTEVTAGSSAVLVYDGQFIPQVRSQAITGLYSNLNYAFKVLPFNSLGKGILSLATTTVTPRSGASAAYTTATGSSLISGIAYRVDEIQVITLTQCIGQTLSIGYNSMSANATFGFNNSLSSSQYLATILETMLSIGTIQVEREDISSTNSR